jgi:hypothetical protein
MNLAVTENKGTNASVTSATRQLLFYDSKKRCAGEIAVRESRDAKGEVAQDLAFITYEGIHQPTQGGDCTLDTFSKLSPYASPVPVGVRLHLTGNSTNVIHIKEGVILTQQRTKILNQRGREIWVRPRELKSMIKF